MSLRPSAFYLLPAAAIAAVAIAAFASWQHFHDPDRLLLRGEAALARGDLDEASRSADRLESAHEDDRAHLLRGELFLARGKINSAVEQINQISEDNATLRVRAAARFGLEFVKLGSRPQAEQLFRYVLSKDADHLDAHRGLAALYFDQGATVKALEHAKEWARLAPSDGAAHRFMGILYMNMLDNKLAIAEFQQALALELPASVRAEALLSLAEVLILDSDYVQALEILDTLDTPSAHVEKACELRAQCLLSQNRSTELRQLLAEALPRFPRHARLSWMQARVFLNDGQPDKAAQILEAALRTERHDTRCRYLLGLAYSALGRKEEATEQEKLLQQTQKLVAELEELENQARAAPWDAGLRRRLAEQCEKLDRFDDAATWRQAAAACTPVHQ